MKESDIQEEVMKILFNHPRVAWAFVVTTGKIKGRGGHWITLGFPGLPDIIGQLRDGRVLAIEVKVPGKKPTDEQLEFIQCVNDNGGLAMWADDASQVWLKLAEPEDITSSSLSAIKQLPDGEYPLDSTGTLVVKDGKMTVI